MPLGFLFTGPREQNEIYRTDFGMEMEFTECLFQYRLEVLVWWYKRWYSCMVKFRTLSKTSKFLLVKGEPERVLRSTDMQTLSELVVLQLAESSWQIPPAYCQSFRSHTEEIRQAWNKLSHSMAACQRLMLSAGRTKFIHMRESFTSLPQDKFHAWFVIRNIQISIIGLDKC